MLKSRVRLTGVGAILAGLVLLAAGTTYARTYALASKEAKQPKASSEPRQERHV